AAVARADADGDGALQWGEVPERMRSRAFERWDQNDDRVIDATEIERMLNIVEKARKGAPNS
ncbi:MAG: hypothetical protein ACC661_06805, partial [Verrucomicrobiales bacterium]